MKPKHSKAKREHTLDRGVSTLDEAAAWLSPKERMALLHDRALLDRLGRLEAGAA